MPELIVYGRIIRYCRCGRAGGSDNGSSVNLGHPVNASLKGATLPERSNLPFEMRGLELQQTPQLLPEYWEVGVDRLIETIHGHIGGKREQPSPAI